MLFLIGLGLGSSKDITQRGLDAIKSCKYVFLESYTSLLVDVLADDGSSGRTHLAEDLGIPEEAIILADRILIEQNCETEILSKAVKENVAFLVVGDPFAATTHQDIYLRAKKMSIEVSAIHNASILNAVGSTGLQLYRFGEVVSLCFWTESWKPTSAFDKILKNYAAGLHTLCLLDIKVKEQSVENMMRGRAIYEPPRFMTASQAASQLLECIEMRTQASDVCKLSPNSTCVAVARLGSKNQQIVNCSVSQMVNVDMGKPLHSLIIPANLHELELEFLDFFKLCS